LPLTVVRAQQAEDSFFDTDFDGGWVGTILSGKSRIPFQLNLNVEGKDGIGFLIIGDEFGGSSTALEVFAAEFTKVTANRITLQIEDTSPLRAGSAPLQSRFATSTLKLSYKAADDSLGGKISGAIKGKVAAARTSPDRPMQRLWQTTVKTGGESTFIQLATTEDADGVIGGHATFNAVTGAVSGQRNGSTVDLTFTVGGDAVTFSGKLKTRNNKLQGAFESDGKPLKSTLIPADGNGKPMKFKNVQRASAVELVPGQSMTVRVVGKNIALGAIAYTDSPDVRVTATDLESTNALSVTLATDAGATTGSAVALRLFNGDGETADKANALTVGGSSEDPVNFDSQIQPIFTNTCAVSGCHAASSAKAGLVLDAASAIDNLVGVPSSQQPGLLRVSPGNADDSYLVRKISGVPGIDGARMPKDRTPLPQAQIDLIRLWITQGAASRQARR
jgi:hypothetical protein